MVYIDAPTNQMWLVGASEENTQSSTAGRVGQLAVPGQLGNPCRAEMDVMFQPVGGVPCSGCPIGVGVVRDLSPEAIGHCGGSESVRRVFPQAVGGRRFGHRGLLAGGLLHDLVDRRGVVVVLGDLAHAGDRDCGDEDRDEEDGQGQEEDGGIAADVPHGILSRRVNPPIGIRGWWR